MEELKIKYPEGFEILYEYSTDINDFTVIVKFNGKKFRIRCSFESGNYIGFDYNKYISVFSDSNDKWNNLADTNTIYPYKLHQDTWSTYYSCDYEKLRFIKNFVIACCNYIKKLYGKNEEPSESTTISISSKKYHELDDFLKDILSNYNKRKKSDLINDVLSLRDKIKDLIVK